MTERFTPDADASPVLLTVPMIADTAPSGAVHGGWIMTQIDHAAGRAGRLFAGTCVIRAVHELTFQTPLHPGEDLAIFARVGKTGRTSFRLELLGYALHGTPAQRAVVDAELTMICIDASGRPRAVADRPDA